MNSDILTRIRKLIVLFAVFSGAALYSQSFTEKSMAGFQLAPLAAFIYYEKGVSEEMALRMEAGQDNAFLGGFSSAEIVVLSPVLSLEPRWYYNLSERKLHSMSISGNSGNFLSLKTSYHPDWFTDITDQISIVPTWGMRREFWRDFDFEFGIGAGYKHKFFESALEKGGASSGEIAYNGHLRIGYNF